MKPGLKVKRLNIYQSLFLTMAIMGQSCAIYRAFARPLPSDAEMQSLFAQNRSAFETVVGMSNEDASLIRISYDFTFVTGKGPSNDTGDTGLSKERWEEYKSYFRILDLDSGIGHYENGSVWFLSYSHGLAVSGISKGYIYSQAPIDCSGKSLDKPDILGEKRFMCKQLDLNWYLYLSN